MIVRIISLLSLLLISCGVQAHQPDLSSTTLVEQGANNWVLQIRSSLTAFTYEIAEYYGDSAYDTPEEFETLVLRYVQENVTIIVNNTDTIGLQNGFVKLGHETSVTFQLIKPLGNFQTLTIHNGSFSGISRNKSIVFLLKDGFEKAPFTLNNANGHTISLEAGDGKFELLNQPETKSPFYKWGLIIAAVVIAIVGFLVIRKKTSIIK